MNDIYAASGNEKKDRNSISTCKIDKRNHTIPYICNMYALFRNCYSMTPLTQDTKINVTTQKKIQRIECIM